MKDDTTVVAESVASFLFEQCMRHPELVRGWGKSFDGGLLRILRQIAVLFLTKWFESENRVLRTAHAPDGFRVERHRSIVVTTLFGAVSVISTYFRRPSDGAGLRPMHDLYGLSGGRFSTDMERAMTDFGMERSFAQAARMVQEHYGVTVAATSMASVSERRARGITHWLQCHYDTAPERTRAQRAETMILAMDGCALRVVEFVAAGCLGRTDVAPETKIRRDRWVDTRLAKARREGDIEGSFVCAFDTFDAVLTQLAGAARTRGLHPDTQVVFLGDGGNGLMEAAKRHFPQAQFILDRCHLRQHLFGVAEHHAMDASKARAWVDQLDAWIGAGHTAWKAINELRGLVPPQPPGQPVQRDPAECLIEYLERFAPCVHYDDYAARGWPTGSGEIESGHRQVPQARLKIAGAAWTPANLNTMAGARAARASGLWEAYWADTAA